MCLVALALGRHPHFPLVIAANRDEFHARPTAPLGWWQADSGSTSILSGRDLSGGGTWMGLTSAGRYALLTNVRAAGQNDPAAPSRGGIVTDWLGTSDDAERFWKRTAARRHNGFNLIAADTRRGECFWASSGGVPPRKLEPGIHGLSNAALDTPWPKVVALKTRLAAALAEADSVDTLASRLFEALADRTLADDAALPSTGLPLDAERLLSSAFVVMPLRDYGTRCSTVLVTERIGGRDVTTLFERTFEKDAARAPRTRRALLDPWPPRPGADDDMERADRNPVSEVVLC